MEHDALSSQEQVGVVGLGYVGLPLALTFADAGYEVVGVDIDEDRIETLSSGNSYINDVDDKTVKRNVSDSFHPTTDYEALADVDGVSICVPTPLRKTGHPDLSYVLKATSRIAKIVQNGCTVVVESTVYPGATEEVIAPTFEDANVAVGDDIFLAFSPERVDPGNEEYGLTDIPKVIGGVTDRCGDYAQALYESIFDDVVRVETSNVAELTKLLENTYRSVNIALINEIATVSHELDVDIWEVIDAASTKPFGFEAFYPGPGLGGHCIPIDPMYLSWKADQHGVDTRIIDLADTINREMPKHIVHRIVDLLNEAGTLVPESEVLILGVTYKPDVSDTRESPALDIIDMLQERNVDIHYHDPYIPNLTVGSRTFDSERLTDERLKSADCTVLLSNHASLPFERIVESSTVVFDTRNALSDYDANHVHSL